MFLDFEHSRLHFECDGPDDAPPVLLWHGALCTLRMWDRVVEALADRNRLIRFDVRGVGESSPPADPSRYSFEQYTRDADALLDHLGVDRVHVWSMAWGSRAALAYLSLQPERVLSAALFDASIGAADVEAQQRGAREALALQEAAGIARFEYPDGWNRHADPAAAQAALAAARRFDLPAAADRIAALEARPPLLVATGDHDPNLASSRELVARIPGARLEVLEQVGHGSVLQRPDLAVQTWLAWQQQIQQ